MLNPDIHFETRAEAFHREAEEKRAARAVEEAEAEAAGKLWTVQIAYHPDHAFALIHFGRIDDSWVEAFTSQNPGAVMFLEPKVILGTKLQVRQAVCELANTNETVIRVLGAPPVAKIEMPELRRV